MVTTLVHRTRGARRWVRVAAVASAIGCIAAGISWCARLASAACEVDGAGGSAAEDGIDACVDRYDRTGDDLYLERAATHAMRTGRLERAERLAVELMRGPLFGSAHQVLSYVCQSRGQSERAWNHASIAFVAHWLAGDELRLSVDAKLLSDAARQRGDFTAALVAADEAVRHAQAAGDSRAALRAGTRAAIARADALRRIGDLDDAIETLGRAATPAREICDRTWLTFKLGLAYEEAGQPTKALAELARAQQLDVTCRNRSVDLAIRSNQAWLLRDSDPVEARRLLDAVILDGGEEPDVLLMRACFAADRGELAAAHRDLMLAEELDPSDADWPWVIAQAQAELAELQGGVLGPVLAEFHYKRAIAMIAALRATARARSAYLVASHRGPYDGLIALLARQGRWREALAVVLELDASDMLRATANAIGKHEPGEIDVRPLVAGAPVPVHATVDEVLDAWRTRDLVIAIAPSRREIRIGAERAYRMRIADGQVTGEDIGLASEAQELADRLWRDPDDRDAARALGARMIPPGPEHTTLNVLAIGALGKAPLAALRDGDDSLLVARRPLVRVLGLESTGPASRGGGRDVVIADPRGKLDSARSEGAMVAAALGPSAQVAGSGTPVAATRALLWGARDAELLHVAGHVIGQGRWRALQLSDGNVEPGEIVHAGLAPRIAVLAGCGSAAAKDGEGWGSLAAALLTAGATVVIAADRSVSDTATLSLMKTFYAQPDWRSDPERALARAQVAFEAGAEASAAHPAQRQAWAAFSVLRRPPVAAPL